MYYTLFFLFRNISDALISHLYDLMYLYIAIYNCSLFFLI